MKGLLHSKRFRANLYRWLFMYVGVMMLFTTVITYSKFLTSFGAENTARVTRFEANIAYTDSDGNVCENSCNTGTYRPTSKIKYYFTVDTEVEVLADLFLTVRIEDEYKDDFKIISIRKIKEGETEIDDSEIVVNDIRKSISVPVNIDQNLHSTYEVIVQYSGNLDKDTIFDSTGNTVIAVGYAVEQRGN